MLVLSGILGSDGTFRRHTGKKGGDGLSYQHQDYHNYIRRARYTWPSFILILVRLPVLVGYDLLSEPNSKLRREQLKGAKASSRPSIDILTLTLIGTEAIILCDLLYSI